MQPCTMCQRLPARERGSGLYFCSDHGPENLVHPTGGSIDTQLGIGGTLGSFCSCGSGSRVSITSQGKTICAECARKDTARW